MRRNRFKGGSARGLARLARCLAAPVLLAALAAGCVTEIAEVPGQTLTTLVTSRAGEEVRGSWNTESGKLYTVLYAPNRDARTQWRVLPGYQMLPGTGGRMLLKDRVPLGENRYYRLYLGKLPATGVTSPAKAPSVSPAITPAKSAPARAR